MTKRVVVVGNGMVGQRFMEKLRKIDDDVQISTFCEEPRAAYNRVQLTKVRDEDDDDTMRCVDSSMMDSLSLSLSHTHFSINIHTIYV